MAVPIYSTDLTTLATGETGDTWGVTGWTEATANTYAQGGTPSQETELYIQGATSTSQSLGTKTGLFSIVFTNNGTGVTVPADGAVLLWHYFAAPTATNTRGAGGLRVLVGNSAAVFKVFYVGGSDFSPYPYGGWINHAVDPRFTANVTEGAPSGVVSTMGCGLNTLAAISKGSPHAVDVIRYGRCEARFQNGEVASAATFNGFAANNDATGNRWGLIQESGGGYQIKGLLVLGYNSGVYFRDQNKVLNWQNTLQTNIGFNKVEVRTANSVVLMDNIAFNALGTQSRGIWTTTDNANVRLTGCTFTDMDWFEFKSNTTITSSTFRRCNVVIQDSSTITGSIFDTTTASTSALLANNLTVISGCEFVAGTSAKHGIEIRYPGEYNFADNTFTGYAATDGSSGSEAIYNNSGGNITINVLGAGNTPTIRNGTSANTTVINAKSLTITNIIEDTEIRILRQSDSTELGGAEVVGPTPTGLNGVTVAEDPNNIGRYKVTYSYNYTTDIPIYVVAMSLDYQWLRSTFTLTSDNSSLQIAQIADRQYFNPA